MKRTPYTPMLYYNLERIFTMRGITKPFTYLVDNGFSVTTASRLLNKKATNVNLGFVEKLCILLKCTPNDLLGWKPGKTEIQPMDIPLAALIRNSNQNDFLKLRTTLSIEELEKLMKSIANTGNETKEEVP